MVMLQFSGVITLHALGSTKLAMAIPIDGATTVPALAESTGLHPDDVARLVNSGATRHVFRLQGKDEVRHSAKSKAIATIPLLANITKFGLDLMWTSAPFVVPAMEKWPGSQEVTQTAYNIANRTNLSFFEDIAAHEEKAKGFARIMAFVQSNPEVNTKFVLEYDWSQHANGTVVDIGGSTGEIAFKIAENHPNINIIVQDRPEVIAHATPTAHKNVEFQVHDFFAPQPVYGADVYFFRWILHDWPTKYCIKILSALKPALKPGARVVLMEAVLPERGVLRPFQERRLRHFDMIMKMLYNAMERTEADWRKLVEEADDEGRFKVAELIRPAGSQLAFVVIEWSG
jgi:ubiquinone/menaquinone biosynthesis C-methylase UbiE